MNIKTTLLRLYDNLNKEYYHGTLPPVDIRFSFATKMYKGWKLQYEPQYTLFIKWKLLECEEEQLYVSMLHQMVHIYNHVNDVKDNCDKQRYHNQYFREEAERIGLVTMYDLRKGYDTVGLQKNEFEKIRKYFDYDKFHKEIVTKERTADIRFLAHKCPKCNRMVKTLESNNIICGFCYVNYVCVEQSWEE